MPKPLTSPKAPSTGGQKHPKPLGGDKQAVAEKAAGAAANVKARVESAHNPDKPPLHHQNMPNSSGRP